MRGLYAITPAKFDSPQALLKDVEAVLSGGARLIQYRDKHSPEKQQRLMAQELIKLCRRYQVPLVINDNPGLAVEVNADGVHLGRHDVTLSEARRLLGPHKLIGVSCYNDLGIAHRASSDGADYLAFGSFYPSLNKPQAVHAPLELLTQARNEFSLPLVAIGGITAQNGAPLIDAGADMLAVIDGVFGQQNIKNSAREIASLFRDQPVEDVI